MVSYCNLCCGANMAFADLKFNCNSQITDKVEIHLATYMLDAPVFNALAAQYMQVPLIFPIQLIQSKDFTKQIRNDATIDNAMTVQLKNADGMYTVFRKDINSYSCFENPQIRYEFNIDGKYYPRTAFDTVEDMRANNLTLDALNFNNLFTTSINKDTADSMQPYHIRYDSPAAGGNLNTAANKKVVYKSGDRSNFCIGIPLADSEDFQGGISTAGTVQIQIIGSRLSNGGIQNVEFGAPVAIFTEDALLKIRSMKPPGRAQVEPVNDTVEQVLAMSGMV